MLIDNQAVENWSIMHKPTDYIHCHLDYLARFHFTVYHLPGKENGNAYALS